MTACRSSSASQIFEGKPAVGPAELVGITAAILILLVAFGSLLAMGLPIVMALFGIGIGLGLIVFTSHGITTPDITVQVASMIGIGVGIDYALFIVTRYRQSLAEGMDPHAATVRAADTAGRAVLFAGGTVVISILGLFVMGVDFVKGLAVGTSLTVAVVMLASITLLPALLGFVGPQHRPVLDPPHADDGDHRDSRSMWFRWSRVVQHHPWISATAGPADPAGVRDPDVVDAPRVPRPGVPTDADTTRRAYDLVAEGFGVGFNGPLVLAAEFPKGADTSALTALSQQLNDTPGVAFASPPVTQPFGRRRGDPGHPRPPRRSRRPRRISSTRCATT